MDPKTLLQSKITTVLLSGMLILVMVVAARLLLQKQEVDREISKLQAETDAIEKNNRQLSELIQYLGTAEYAEKEAREKLNLKKEGEHVVVLPKDSSENMVATNTVDNESNPKKWFNYFFGEVQ